MKELKEKIIGKGGDDMVIENLSRIWDMHYERGVIEGKKEGKRAGIKTERKKMMETYQAFETHLSAILKILDAQGISMDDFLVKVSLDKQGNVAEFSIDLNDGAFSKMTDGAWRELEKLKGK